MARQAQMSKSYLESDYGVAVARELLGHHGVTTMRSSLAPKTPMVSAIVTRSSACMYISALARASGMRT